LPSF
jgi:hypothetical protein